MAGGRRKRTAPASAWLERSLEPRVANGCGMRVLSFVPAGGIVTQPLKAKEEKKRRKRPEVDPEETNADEEPKTSKDEADPQEANQEEGLSVVRGATKWKKGRPLFEHGNYSSYYGYRHAPGERGDSDRRLVALADRLGKSFFKRKEVLDIGCNAGLVSLAMAREFSVARVVGMDLDADLIEAAQANYSCEMDNLQGIVEFRREDILSCPLRRGPEETPERFDVVLCLSVTKWVHFAHGDTGIRNLFKRVFKRTRPGGYFILEPQGWGSYKKKRHITRAIRDTVASIELRPEAFAECLVEMGFEQIDTIEPPDGLPKNFQRPLLIFQRPDLEVAEENEELPRKRKAARFTE